jgi:hypothetical protein
MCDIRKWATEYEARGLALARIKPGQKQPTDEAWTEFSFPANAFSEQDNIGLQSGGRSGNVVRVDLDSTDAVRRADEFLPDTLMVDGREGKPRSHRWYRVTHVPEELTASPSIAGGVGGPRTRQFHRQVNGKRETVVEFRGTGTQAVVPSSIWSSKDGTRTEKRIWHVFEDPRVIEAAELFECVSRLATACGCVPKKAPHAPGQMARPAEPPIPLLPMPAGVAVHQARTYISAIPPAVEGEGGDAITFRVACLLVLDFGLTIDQAWRVRCLSITPAVCLPSRPLPCVTNSRRLMRWKRMVPAVGRSGHRRVSSR